jgi:hypothetical protein
MASAPTLSSGLDQALSDLHGLFCKQRECLIKVRLEHTQIDAIVGIASELPFQHVAEKCDLSPHASVIVKAM